MLTGQLSKPLVSLRGSGEPHSPDTQDLMDKPLLLSSSPALLEEHSPGALYGESGSLSLPLLLSPALGACKLHSLTLSLCCEGEASGEGGAGVTGVTTMSSEHIKLSCAGA